MALFCAALEEIQFLSESFSILAMSKSFCERFRLIAIENIHTVAFLPIFAFLVIVVLLILMLFVLFLVSVISPSLFLKLKKYLDNFDCVLFHTFLDTEYVIL